ncbi:MAG: hypothetical protein ABIH69_02855 [bacterium]
MNYLEFKNALKKFTLFSLADVHKVEATTHRRRLYEWQKKGYIKKIVKGYYIFSDQTMTENTLFEIANRIYPPSYISFETALSYHNLIPESVFAITSASSRRTYRFKTQLGNFIYRTLKPELFVGYDLVQSSGKCFKIACLEKALLDYLYLNPSIKTQADFASLRINKQVLLKKLKEKKLHTLLRLFSQKSLTKRVKSFLKGLRND